MDKSSDAGGRGSGSDVGGSDYVADAANALADAFRHADTLHELAAHHDRDLAASCAQSMREALILVLLALCEARRERRRMFK